MKMRWIILMLMGLGPGVVQAASVETLQGVIVRMDVASMPRDGAGTIVLRTDTGQKVTATVGVGGGLCNFENIWGMEGDLTQGDRVEVAGLRLENHQIEVCGPTHYVKKMREAMVALTRSMVKVRSEGGLCPYGVCYAEEQIFSDGLYAFYDGDGSTKTGKIMDQDMKTFQSLIESTDFDQMRAVPFTGVCPAAYDGQRLYYTFFQNQGEQILDSCRHQIDSEHVLLRRLTSLLTSAR